jgi:Zn-dependent oligopeptidase
MPARGHQKSDPVDHRTRVQLTAAQAARLAELADNAGMSQSEYMRSLLDSATGSVSGVPKPTRQSGTMLQLVTNINQLAHQANRGMVPLTRGEVEQMLALHEQLMLRAIAVVEKALPE